MQDGNGKSKSTMPNFDSDEAPPNTDKRLLPHSAFHGAESVLGESSNNLVNSSCTSHMTKFSDSSRIGSIRRRNSGTHSKEQLVAKEIKQQATNRKATIVIEHIIQASDVSHTVGFQQWSFENCDFRCLNIFFFILPIRCNTGRCIESGTRGFFGKCV